MQLYHQFRWLVLSRNCQEMEQHLEEFLLHKTENESDHVVEGTGEETLRHHRDTPLFCSAKSL